MAAPRCAASFFGTAKRIRISNPRPLIQNFSRCESSDAKTPPKSDNKGDANKTPAVNAAKAPVGIDVAPRGDAVPASKPKEELLAQLAELDIVEEEAEKFATLWKSQEEANKRTAEWMPKTKDEATNLWAKLREEPDHFNMLNMYRNAGIEPIKLAKERGIELPGGEKPALDEEVEKQLQAMRDPINVQAIHLRPLRRAPIHGIPTADLQLRSYSIRNLQFFADFAMRAAYYLGLPARGPVPLPRITERWTVPRSNFIFKKSQENFERITMRRLIQIQDGHPDVVKIWLAFCQKHAYHGIGMKANIWEYESLEDALSVGRPVEKYEGRREEPMFRKIEEILGSAGYKEAMRDYKSPAELRP